METVLKKEDLRAWVAELEAKAQVYAPAFVDDVWGFQHVQADGEVSFDHTNTVRPPKGFVFPQREVLYKFEHERGKAPVLTSTVPDPQPTVVFGVRPCDSRGMVRNDKVFTCGIADPYYQARRDKVAFVGLACNTPPSPGCFCKATGGSPHAEDGLDILMTDLDDRYYVKAITAKGVELVERARRLFNEAKPTDQDEVAKTHAEADRQPQRGLPSLEAVAAGLKKNFDSPAWQKLAEACISCGICTYLCPTCHCFDINDEMTSNTACKGERVRTWDNCQFPDFTMHTSGHNPRDDLGSRLRQRVAHKFLYFVENHNMQQCTGCGRCTTQCPVGIDIVRVVDEVSGQ